MVAGKQKLVEKMKTDEHETIVLSSTIENDLRGVYGTKVSVVSKNGKGKVEIEFYSAEERERIVDLLKSI